MQENVFAHLVTPLLLSHTLSIFTIIIYIMTDYSTTASKPNVSVSLPADVDSINCYPLMRLKMLLEDTETLTYY